MSDLHRIDIEIPDGHAYLARILLDGQEVKGVIGFRVETRIGTEWRSNDEPVVVLTLSPSFLHIEGNDVETHVYQHQQTERRRRPYWAKRTWRQRIREAWTAVIA